MKAVGYIRVSTTEQKLHGYSLDAQRELLERYAASNDMVLTGIYADEGISASKALHKRKGILQLLNDAEHGMFDVILFKDLSRWSRNASQFYAVQDRLDKCKVSWIAVEQPNLETVTASGRLLVGIHISVAAHESAQTSERIKFVMQSRAEKGFAVFNDQSMPLGFKRENDRVVHNQDQEQIVKDVFDTFEASLTFADVGTMLRDRYGIHATTRSIRRWLRNPLYKGEYRDVQNYCEPYIDAERWERIERSTHLHQYTPPSGRAYLFTSLLVCKECGCRLVVSSPRKDPYYRCKKYADHLCTHSRQVRESVVEQFALDAVRATLDRYQVIEKPKKQKSPAPIRQKLERLKDLYIDGDISKDVYTQRKESLEAELASLNAVRSPKIAFPDGWEQFYLQAPNEQKKAAWRSVIDHIEVDNENNMEIFFCDGV